MDTFKSSNPVLGDKILNRSYDFSTRVMTLNGTINKSLLGVALVLLSGYFAWYAGNPALMWVGLIGGFVTAIVTAFKPHLAPYTTPVYAILEGLCLGMLSSMIDAQYSGVVAQAIAGTGITFFVMLILYRTRVIRVTQTFRNVVIASTLGLATVYLIFFVMSLFGHVSFLAGNSGLSIGVTAFAVVIAALNLALDFDTVDQLVENRAPKYMEWYGAFSLLVTLVWLYIELLRLLSKLASRNN